MTVAPDPQAVEDLLALLVPERAGFAACTISAPLYGRLTAEERTHLRTAEPPRRAEFAAGRFCAHRALAAIVVPAETIGRGRRGQPMWPEGVTGSISHAAGLAVAVAAKSTPCVAAIGIDVELAQALEDDLWSQVLTPGERVSCEAAGASGVTATTIFSVKEAAFKAVYPLLGVEVDFLQAHTELDADAGTVAIPHIAAAVAVRHGRVGPFLASVAVAARG
jgi:4'-phosphopantetheinyl transferase EntD